MINPTGGLGYRVYDRESFRVSISGGLGFVWEKNPGLEVDRRGSLNSGQNLEWKLSDSARVTQELSAIWKTSDIGDALYHFGAGISSAVTRNSELKLEFINDYKSRPPDPTIKKNDQALVTSIVFRF